MSNRVLRPTRFFVLLTLLWIWAAPDASTAQAASVHIAGRALIVDGRPFTIKGVHYGPWRPGTGPNKGYPYPSPDLIDADLQQIEQLHANTVLVVDPPPYVLDAAARHHLYVLDSVTIDWWRIGGRDQAKIRASILARIDAVRDKPALLGWVLGNEVPSAVLDMRGSDPVTAGLADLYGAVKAHDPVHPVTHANWPVAKQLRLDFLDFISFNVYPLWPPEVVAKGVGPYIHDVLRPIAGNKPLLITEFGANTTEAGADGQARLISDSWRGLRSAGTIGGIVFEFADEWWKNYDNPKRAGDWWDRESAPNDEQRQDADPEESYGIVTAQRVPKPAFYAAQAMFAPATPSTAGFVTSSRAIPLVFIGVLVLIAVSSWRWAAVRQRQPGGSVRR